MNIKITLIFILTLCFLATSKGQETEKEGNADNQLIATYVVIPRYFAAALATRSQGEVLIEVEISPEGNVIEAKAISGNKILGGNSIYVLKMWKFNPSLNGKTRKTEIIFSYKLVSKREISTEGLTVFKLPFRVEITEVIQEQKPTFTRKVKTKNTKPKK
jgi:TonB family protein